MGARDWIVTANGQCQPRPSARDWDLVRERYYLHQFLTEILEILEHASHEHEEWDYLPQIRMRVRQLIMNSYWVRTRHTSPHSKTGVGIYTLYDEIGYPLTVQTETRLPGTLSPIHNHGTWGVVSVISGKEEHTFWQRSSDDSEPVRVRPVGKRIMGPGEILSFVPEAIHQVRAIAPEPAVTFCMYGDTQPKSRFRFDPVAHTATQF